jgi:hypothetical protein
MPYSFLLLTSSKADKISKEQMLELYNTNFKYKVLDEPTLRSMLKKNVFWDKSLKLKSKSRCYIGVEIKVEDFNSEVLLNIPMVLRVYDENEKISENMSQFKFDYVKSAEKPQTNEKSCIFIPKMNTTHDWSKELCMGTLSFHCRRPGDNKESKSCSTSCKLCNYDWQIIHNAKYTGKNESTVIQWRYNEVLGKLIAERYKKQFKDIMHLCIL